MKRAVVVLAAGLACASAARKAAATPAVATRTPDPASGAAPASGWAGPSAPVVRLGGRAYVSTTDLARLLGATRFWRADTRKLVLGVRDHRLTLTVDNPFVVVDSRTWRLEAPVRSIDGDVHAPIGLLGLLPPADDGGALTWDEVAARVRRPAAPIPGPIRITLERGLTRVQVPTAAPGEWGWIDRSRQVVRLRVPGARTVVPDSIPGGALVRSVTAEAGGARPIFALALAPGAEWVRVTAETTARRVLLEIAPEALANGVRLADAPAAPRRLRTIVLDPGHGGADPGVRADGIAEKDVALALARTLAGELERRTGARVRLTREFDETLAQDVRAERSNRERADVVLSLHADGLAGSRARGATLWVAPETDGRADVLPLWREAASRHARASRDLAGTIARTLRGRGLGPARVRERLPIALIGVDAPGIVIECGVLTSPEDHARLAGPGLRELAIAIADAVAEWAKA